MAFKVIISKEYKPHKSGKYKFKRVRLGAYFFGEIREYNRKTASGRTVRIYWSARIVGEEQSKNKMWAFDKSVMSKMFNEGACLTHIGVMVTTDAKRKISDPSLITEMWLTKVETYRSLNMNGAMPHDLFHKIEREVEDDVKIKMIKVGGRA